MTMRYIFPLLILLAACADDTAPAQRSELDTVSDIIVADQQPGRRG
jgi:hypothetical protein